MSHNVNIWFSEDLCGSYWISPTANLNYQWIALVVTPDKVDRWTVAACPWPRFQTAEWPSTAWLSGPWSGPSSWTWGPRMGPWSRVCELASSFSLKTLFCPSHPPCPPSSHPFSCLIPFERLLENVRLPICVIPSGATVGSDRLFSCRASYPLSDGFCPHWNHDHKQ